LYFLKFFQRDKENQQKAQKWIFSPVLRSWRALAQLSALLSQTSRTELQMMTLFHRPLTIFTRQFSLTFRHSFSA
jgi:hypothetical protein